LAKSTSIGAECSKKREETLVNWKKKIKFSFSKAEYFLLAKSRSIGAEWSKKMGNFRNWPKIGIKKPKLKRPNISYWPNLHPLELNVLKKRGETLGKRNNLAIDTYC
jgi:hypothetical protein